MRKIKIGSKTIGSIGSAKSKDDKYSNAICAYLLLDSINSVLSPVFGLRGTLLTIAKGGLGACVLWLIADAILAQSKKKISFFASLEFLALLMYVWSAVIGARISDNIEWYVQTAAFLVPVMFLTYSVKDYRVLYGKMKVVIYPILLLNLSRMIRAGNDLYDMHFSYSMVFVVIILVSELFQRDKITWKKVLFILLLVALSSVLLFAYGSRGAIVCIVAYIAVKIIINNSSWQKKAGYLLCILLICIMGGILYANPKILLGIISKLGFRGRSLILLLNGSFLSYTTGRNVIWDNALDAISRRPLVGWGIKGALREYGFPYPHQFFLDILVTFGIPAGVCFSAIVLLRIARLFFVKQSYYKEMIIIFFCISFVCLQFSSTLFTNQYWFILMGLLIKKVTPDSLEHNLKLTGKRKRL